MSGKGSGLAWSCVACICLSFLLYWTILSLIVILCFIFVPSARVGSSFVHTGDMLGDSSALLVISTPTIATVTFEMQHDTIIYSSNFFPQIVTGNFFSHQHFVISSVWSDKGDLNYLGNNEPIYLLNGSSIQYNATIEYNDIIKSRYAACLYLFNDRASFNNFIDSNLVGQYIPVASYCFASNTTTIFYSFNITANGVYYVGIALCNNVTIEVSASVVRKHYNTTGLKQVCTYVQTCSFSVCNALICNQKSTTYFLIRTINTTDINYTLSSPKYYDSSYVLFLTVTVIVSILGCSCCCLIMMTFTSCMAIIIHEGRSDNDNRPITAVTPDSNRYRPIISHESEDSIDSFDKDLKLALYLSSLDDTNYRNTNASCPSPIQLTNFSILRDDPCIVDLNEHKLNQERNATIIEELEEENNQNKIGDQLHDDVSLTDFLRDEPSLAELFDPSKQWDIFNQEETTTNLDEQQQELVQHEVTEQSSFKTKQSNIYTSDHNEANSLNTVSAIGDLNMAVSHIVPLDDVLLPLPSPLEEYKTLSLHSPEVESVEAVNEHSNTTEGDILPHDISTINEGEGVIQSSDKDGSRSPYTTPESSITSSVESLPINEPLPSNFKERLNESHAPVILSVIKDLVGLWDIVGLYLGIDNADLERIKYNHSTDVDHCRKEMIFVWLRRRNATRHGLIKALKEAGRNDIAHKVKNL